MRRASFALWFVGAALAACSSDGGSSEPSNATPSAGTGISLELGADLDVDGRSMHIVCVGPTDTGEPTILLEAGGGLDSTSWSDVMAAMQSKHRLCAYDRAGLGLSDPPTEQQRFSADQVADLHRLLDAAGVSGPFVIGAHSVGAIVATLFTAAHPDDVVALLLVDPQAPHVDDRFSEALPPESADEPVSVADFRRQLNTFDDDPSLNPEHVHLRPSFIDAATVLDAPGPLFEDRPLVVLSAGKKPGSELGLPRRLATKIDQLWAAAQQELADESTAGSFETVPGAGHTIQVDKPPAVIHALEGILADLPAK